MMIWTGLFMYLMGCLVFCSNRKHLLLTLLSLEFISLSLFFMLMIVLLNLGFSLFLSMVVLTMSVCEGVLGLSILIMLMRSHGSDYYLMFNTLW
uniref:NADH-ubiquinone oxidoreductase chain 4L n=1 Tax=Histeroidea sp. 1 KM-2017 TaxID=2219434 RepID=A0A346RGT9_9COLE|nr:NADH dehydrogenase subunit 4L [Histeroidea sp. 1 KM-2017]